jgi:uncharacterized membrane protein YkvA (DUF1232 family)
MAVRLTPWLWQPGLLRILFSRARLAMRLLREPRVPILAKAVPLIAALYLVSPLDVVPDVFPLVGQIDDLTLILVALAVFLRLCPPAAVAFHRGAIADGRPFVPMSPTDDVIDTKWRRESGIRAPDSRG